MTEKNTLRPHRFKIWILIVENVDLRHFGVATREFRSSQISKLLRKKNVKHDESEPDHFQKKD